MDPRLFALHTFLYLVAAVAFKNHDMDFMEEICLGCYTDDMTDPSRAVLERRWRETLASTAWFD